MGIHYIQMAVDEQQQTVNNVFIEGKKQHCGWTGSLDFRF